MKRWPTSKSGPIADTRETWSKIHGALVKGCRGFPGDSSLAQLLARRCGKRNHLCLPRLNERKMLAWADACFEAQGKWPGVNSGMIAGTQETWSNIDNALLQGHRGLPGGSTLAQLLMRRRGVGTACAFRRSANGRSSPGPMPGSPAAKMAQRRVGTDPLHPGDLACC